jgi:hypothetical protein
MFLQCFSAGVVLNEVESPALMAALVAEGLLVGLEPSSLRPEPSAGNRD